MLRRSSHAVFECKYHLVWSTKYRKRVLVEEHERKECAALLRRAAEEYGMWILGIEVDVDHVHIYLEIPPQRSVGRAVGILKSLSARKMFKRFPYLRRKYWGGEFWEDSYFARSVGESVTGVIVKEYLEKHRNEALGPAQGELFPKERAESRRRR